MKNIILITIDCMRGDTLLLPELYPSEHLDRLRRDSVTFTHCISSGPVTPFAFRGLFTGRYPLVNWSQGKLPDSMMTMAEILKKAGYRTAGIHDNPYLHKEFGYGRGFDIFCDNVSNYNEITSEKIAAQAAEYTESDSPFFLWAHFMDLHGPYMFPKQYFRHVHLNSLYGRWVRKKLAKNFRNIVGRKRRERAARKLYRAAFRWSWDSVGTFLSQLDPGLYEDALIIVTADHGDGLGEHGYIGHFSYLYDDVLHIPLIFKLPGNAHAGTVCGSTVSQLDILPTILAAAEADQGSGSFDGCDISSGFAGDTGLSNNHVISECIHKGYRCTPRKNVFYPFDPAMCRIAVRSGYFKYIFDGETDSEELYDLEHDPGETENAAGSFPDKARELKNIFSRHMDLLKSTNSEQTTDKETDVDSSIRERLRSLGYME